MAVDIGIQDCDCESCIALGLAPPRHVGDCQSCNADGPTTTVEDSIELCFRCMRNVPEAMEEISISHATRDDRCIRGSYYP